MDSAQSILSIVFQAQDQASGTIQHFGDSLNNILEIATGFSLANVASQIVEAGKTAIDSVSEFEAFSASLSTVLGNAADYGDDSATSFAGSAGKVADVAQKTADEMRQYSEKIKEINDNMQEVLSGQNIIDEQRKLNQELESLAEAHAQKLRDIQDSIQSASEDLATREEDRATKMQDSLENLTDDHNLSVADKQEKYEQDLAKAKGDIQRRAITQKFEEEKQLDDDAFSRKYALQQQRLQKQMDEENAKDKAQTDKKIATLQDQINKENAVYDKQKQKDQQNADEQIVKYKTENDKKLALYKQELADEEIAHKEHLEQLQKDAASAAGGGLSPKMQELPINSQFRITKESAKGLQSYLAQIFNQGTPFQLSDWEEFSQKMTEAKVNAQQLTPAIENIAAANHISMSEAGQVIFQGMQGNVKGMSSILHISAEELHKAGAEFTEVGTLKDKESFFTALQKIGTTTYASGLKDYAQTFKGTAQEIKNSATNIVLSILGINTATGKIDPGSIFAQLKSGLQSIASFLISHKTDIANFFKDTFEFLVKNKDVIVASLLGIGAALAVLVIVPAIATGFAVLSAVFAAFEVGGLIAGLGGIVAILGGPIILVVAAVALAVAGLYLAWKSNFLNIQGIVGTVVSWFQSHVLPVLSGVWNGIKFGLTVLWDFFVLSFAGITTAAGAVIGWFSKTFGPTLSALWDGIKQGWELLWQNFHKPIEAVATTIINAVKNMLNGIISLFDNLIKGANSIGKKVPGFIQIPEIPHLATGTPWFEGGMALVGERGPELVNLPRGSSVTPNHQTNQYTTRSAHVTLGPVYVSSPMDVDSVMRRLSFALRTDSSL